MTTHSCSHNKNQKTEICNQNLASHYLMLPTQSSLCYWDSATDHCCNIKLADDKYVNVTMFIGGHWYIIIKWLSVCCRCEGIVIDGISSGEEKEPITWRLFVETKLIQNVSMFVLHLAAELVSTNRFWIYLSSRLNLESLCEDVTPLLLSL